MRLLAALLSAVVVATAASPAHAENPYAPVENEQVTYTEMRDAIAKREVKRAELFPLLGVAKLTLDGGRTVKADYPVTDEGLAADLTRAGAQVTVNNRGPSAGASMVLPVLLMLGIVGVAIFLLSRARRPADNGGLNGRQTVENARVGADNVPDVRFADVAGVDEAVASLQDMLVFLTDPDRFTRLGASLPRGILFHGPPGTGKTLLARALAGEAGVPFFSVSGSEFVEMLVGRGAARMRSLFDDARKHPAAVIFFDEFDALGKRRGAGVGGNDEREQTLNQLLVEMDGFDKTSRIVCIAATNRLDTLDPAVLRPGRFGEQILVDLPSEEGRRQILAVHARSKPFAADVDLDRLAHITYGSSGADLADMLNRAAIKAGKADRDEITQADLEDGYLDAIAGPVKRNAALAGTEREVVAVHEAGHVLAAELCPTVEKAMRVSIQPRGRAGGMAVYGRTDRMLHDTQYLHEKLIGILGGRAAEFVTRGMVTSGAANDLQQANAMARQAVEELGFSARAGQLVSTANGQQVRVSDETVALVDSEVRRLVEEAYQDAIRLLTAHRDELDRLAAALLTAEDLDRPEIVAVLSGVADTPRAAPRRAPIEHDPTPAPARAVVHAPARRRGEGLRVRLAALLLREPAGRRAYSGE